MNYILLYTVPASLIGLSLVHNLNLMEVSGRLHYALTPVWLGMDLSIIQVSCQTKQKKERQNLGQMSSGKDRILGFES